MYCSQVKRMMHKSWDQYELRSVGLQTGIECSQYTLSEVCLCLQIPQPSHPSKSIEFCQLEGVQKHSVYVQNKNLRSVWTLLVLTWFPSLILDGSQSFVLVQKLEWDKLVSDIWFFLPASHKQRQALVWRPIWSCTGLSWYRSHM